MLPIVVARRIDFPAIATKAVSFKQISNKCKIPRGSGHARVA
jgi:hypothetical protein